MAAFKRMLQVGIKVDNCLMRYRASKARSTSSSSSLKEFSKKKMDLHPEHEAGISLDEFERRMEKLCKVMDSDVAEFGALMEKSKRESKDFYESQFVATDKYLRKLAIGTIVCVNGAFIFAASARQSVKEDHGPSP